MYDTFVKALMHSWVFFELSSPLQITNIFYVPTKQFHSYLLLGVRNTS